MSEKLLAEVVHSLKGRLRLRFPTEKRNQDFFQNLLESLSNIESIRNIKVNPLTGSVLIQYDGELGETIQRLEEKFEIKRVGMNGKGEPLRKTILTATRRLDEKIKKFFSYQLDLRTLLALFFLLLGLNEIRKGKWSSPPWYFTLMAAITLLRPSR
jgi:hypothetical protein